MKTKRFYNVKIASNIGNIRNVVNEIINRINGLCGVDDRFVYDTKVILNELIINAIKHGNNCINEKSVKVSAALINDQYLLFSIQDEGEGYCRDTSISENEPDGLNNCCSLLEGGRGIIIVKCLCDKLKFNRKGNRVLVLKRINS
ncbi:MAG TPA: ATP-binding protein [Pseudobacteroides sp.]|uniref:ATP-binding protein n=1 Tax=Pseudobacteroides sp. TaxID=1968840 RepID=UPI002F93B706